LGATAANFGARLHFVAVKRLAGYGAGFADLGTKSAGGGVMRRAARHEIGRRLAGLDTVIHQQGMIMRHMRAALIETMVIKSILATVPAAPALFNAYLDMFGVGSHGASPFVSARNRH